MTMPVDTNKWELLKNEGYDNNAIAWEKLKECYSNMEAQTHRGKDGKWYIVQSKASMFKAEGYILLEEIFYDSKSEAYEIIQARYSHMRGVTAYCSYEKWYIVQRKSLMY